MNKSSFGKNYKPRYSTKEFDYKDGLKLTPAEMKHPDHFPKSRPSDCRHCRYSMKSYI